MHHNVNNMLRAQTDERKRNPWNNPLEPKITLQKLIRKLEREKHEKWKEQRHYDHVPHYMSLACGLTKFNAYKLTKKGITFYLIETHPDNNPPSFFQRLKSVVLPAIYSSYRPTRYRLIVIDNNDDRDALFDTTNADEDYSLVKSLYQTLKTQDKEHAEKSWDELKRRVVDNRRKLFRVLEQYAQP